jgi:beta-glucosidase
MSLTMRILTTFTLAVVTMAAPALAQPKYPFQDPALDPEKRIDNAISLLTLDEKIAGLGASGVESTRLGIRKMDIGEALSGVVLGGPMSTLVDAFPNAPAELRMQPTPTTQFSQGVGFGRTWDAALVRKAGEVIGSEARYIFENGKNPKAFLVLLTPTWRETRAGAARRRVTVRIRCSMAPWQRL